MEEVIKMIIQIEDKAQKIIDDALEEKRQKEASHKERIKELEQKTIGSAKRKVEQIREREFNEIKEDEEAKVKKCHDHLKKMDVDADAKMATWVDELYKRVIY